MRHVAADMTERLPELAHIDLSRVCVAFTQARKAGPHGLQASLTPLRFPGGATEGIRRGRRYRVQRVVDRQGREMLYILTFCLPRFMDLVLREKLITVLHELWHISPAFDGDIRRHAGRCYAHTHSQKEYDEEMGRLADRWLEQSPPASLYAFLHHDFASIVEEHGALFGMRVSRPRLIPV
jgi:predicted metallopeptidase